MASPARSWTECLRTEMRHLRSRPLLQVVVSLAVAVPAVLVAFLSFSSPDATIDSEGIIVGSTFLAFWQLAPTFLVGACAAGPGRVAGPVARPPSPVPVLAARIVSVLLVVTALPLVGAALLVVVDWPAGSPWLGDPDQWDVRARMIGLTLVLAWATAVLGSSFAAIGRRTAVAGGALAAYAGAWDLPLLIVVGDPGEGLGRTMFSMQALSWLAQPQEFAGSSISGPFPRVEAGLTIGALAVAAAVAAFVIEHRRARPSSSRPAGAADVRW